jgi:hypothetical protein
MRIAITILIDMTDAQVADYAAEYGLPVRGSDRPMARDVVEDVRTQVLTAIQCSTAFGDGAADVSLKR